MSRKTDTRDERGVRLEALRKIQHFWEAHGNEKIIRTALAHALFDVDPVLYEGFAHTVFDLRAPPCDACHMLADRITEELEYAGFEVISTRETPRERMTPRIGRMELVDLIEFALQFGGKIGWANLGDPSPAVAGEWRKKATLKICEALSIARVVLRQRKGQR